VKSTVCSLGEMLRFVNVAVCNTVHVVYVNNTKAKISW